MACEEISKIIESILTPLLDEYDLELFELNINTHNKFTMVEVIADKARGGVNMGECGRINKALSREIEEKELIEGNFSVDVCSPGLDRPMKVQKDFVRVIGRNAKFHLTEPVAGKLEHDGTIEDVEQDDVIIKTKSESLKIPLAKINKAVQII